MKIKLALTALASLTLAALSRHRRPREVSNVEDRCADIAEWARRARKVGA